MALPFWIVCGAGMGRLPSGVTNSPTMSTVRGRSGHRGRDGGTLRGAVAAIGGMRLRGLAVTGVRTAMQLWQPLTYALLVTSPPYD